MKRICKSGAHVDSQFACQLSKTPEEKNANRRVEDCAEQRKRRKCTYIKCLKEVHQIYHYQKYSFAIG